MFLLVCILIFVVEIMLDVLGESLIMVFVGDFVVFFVMDCFGLVIYFINWLGVFNVFG